MLNNETVLTVIAAAATVPAAAAAPAFYNNSTSNQTSTAFPSSSPIEEFDIDTPAINSLRNEHRLTSIILSVNGSISFICSCTIMYHILQSHQGLSKTYHRLVFGLCVGDVLSSFAYVLGSTMSPKELSYYIPWAKGNVATCSFQGFLSNVGSNCAVLYNCSICLYYLAIVRYNKQDVYIKAKLEPWFHAVAIVVPITIGISLLFLKMYNTAGAICGPYPHYPPHCYGYDIGDTPDIPCGRGDWTSEMQGYSDKEKAVLWLCATAFPVLLTPFVIIITMVMMYRSLLKIQMKVQRYGAGSLYLNSLRASKKNIHENRNSYALNNVTDGNRGQNEENFGRSMRESIACLIPWNREKKALSKSKFNRAKSQKKRSIVYMAFSYSLAWAFTWVPFFIFYLSRNHTTGMVATVFTPLQGLFNLFVYMSPKVRNAKTSKRAKLTWHQAILKAWKSKGERRREITRAGGNNKSLMKSKQWMKQIASSRIQRKSRRTSECSPSYVATTPMPFKAKVRVQKKNENVGIKDDDEADGEEFLPEKSSKGLLLSHESRKQKISSVIMVGDEEDVSYDVPFES